MRSLLVLGLVALVVCAPLAQAEGTTETETSSSSAPTESSTTFSSGTTSGPPDPGSGCRPMCL